MPPLDRAPHTQQTRHRCAGPPASLPDDGPAETRSGLAPRIQPRSEPLCSSTARAREPAVVTTRRHAQIRAACGPPARHASRSARPGVPRAPPVTGTPQIREGATPEHHAHAAPRIWPPSHVAAAAHRAPLQTSAPARRAQPRARARPLPPPTPARRAQSRACPSPRASAAAPRLAASGGVLLTRAPHPAAPPPTDRGRPSATSLRMRRPQLRAGSPPPDLRAPTSARSPRISTAPPCRPPASARSSRPARARNR